ncbi:MAG TPA: DUF5691 domain-containing protein [Gallionellaceae bacterium]|nr:DUF5691 domain-containing protein [Gallionellaceae bacterium]
MLLQQALIGTMNGFGGLHGLPEEVRASVPELPPEQQLLIAAGVWSVYREAGRQAVLRPLPQPAPEAREKYVPANIQTMLDECLKGEWENWWPVVATRLARHGYVVSPGKMVSVLNAAKPQQQAAWRPLLGTRGLWLAQQNAAWSWALADAEKIERSTRWLEGNLAERVQALREQRGEDAASARAWLEAVWKGEKADVRQALLEPLLIGLGQEDEPFLNACLADRSQAVRATAVHLLSLLPASALAQRLRERAMSWVQWQAPAAQGALGKLAARLSGSAQGRMVITPATAWDKSWSKDGLEETPPQGEGARAFWLRQLVSIVPPALWQEHTGQAAESYIKAALASDWGDAMVDGLCAATVRFHDAEWAYALYRALLDRSGSAEWREKIFPLATVEQRYELCAAHMKRGDPDVAGMLAHCPLPWPESLQQATVRLAQQSLRQATQSGNDQEALLALGEQAALLLPSALLAQYKAWWQEAVDELETHTENWRARFAAAAYRRQLELIERRLQFDKEIPL